MSESEILYILEKRKNKWFKSNELAEMTGIGLCSTNRKLRGLREFEFVKFKRIASLWTNQRYLYKFKG